MDAEQEADNMLAVLNNVQSELMTARNKVQAAIQELRKRGVDEDDVRAEKARVSNVAIDLDVTADGLESISEPVEE
jgi:hypothetical protein